MEMRQVLAAEELMYRPFTQIIAKRIYEDMGIVPETPMQCHPMYPDTFEAVFLAKNKVYTAVLTSNPGGKNTVAVFEEDFKGYYPTGAFIRTREREVVWT